MTTTPIDVEANLDRLLRLVRQPSISEGDRGVRETAALLAQLHREVGFDVAEVAETAGLPGVWAYLDQGRPQTLVVYTMFDSGPLGGGWTRDPYGAAIDHAGGGRFARALYGKGVRQKGPFVAFLAAIDALVRSGARLPVNVACLLDGEEFLGSTHYHDLVERYAARIPGAVGGINPTCNQGATGAHALALANKGCAYLDVRVRGAHWGKGPLGAQVHSSAQGVVHSPAWRLVEALGTLVDGEGGTHVAIEGFYDGDRRPGAEERAMLERLAAGVAPSAWRSAAPGVAGFGEAGEIVDGLTGADLLERALYGTTFNLSGLRSGYVGIDAPLFSLPGVATARLDVRYAPPEDGRRLVYLLREHLDRRGFPEVEVVDLGTHVGSEVPEDHPILATAVEVARESGIETTLWPMRAAGAPVGVIGEVLGVPTLGGVGLGFGGSAAGADEYYVLSDDGGVAGFEAQARYYAAYLTRLRP